MEVIEEDTEKPSGRSTYLNWDLIKFLFNWKKGWSVTYSEDGGNYCWIS